MKFEKIGDIVDIKKGKKAPFTSSTFNPKSTRYIQIEDLRSNGKLQYADDLKGVNVNKKDICLAWDGANAGTVGYNLVGIIGSTIARLRIKNIKLDYILPAYIGKFLQSKFDFLNKSSNGVTIPHIDKNKLLNLQIPLPPLSEQKRIAAILDKVDGIIRKRKQSIKLLDELVKAKFVEMFGDLETNEKGWKILNLENISEIKIGPFGTMLHRSDYIKNGHPVINPSNIFGNEIISDINFTISDAKYNLLLPYKLEIGDIVLGRRGEMGRCAVAKISNMLCGTGCVKIKLKDGFEPDFIQFIIASPFYKKLLSNNSVGITMQNLNMDILAGLPIYNIPYAFQKKFTLILSKISVIKMQQNLAIQDSIQAKNSLIKQFFTIDM